MNDDHCGLALILASLMLKNSPLTTVFQRLNSLLSLNVKMRNPDHNQEENATKLENN